MQEQMLLKIRVTWRDIKSLLTTIFYFIICLHINLPRDFLKRGKDN